MHFLSVVLAHFLGLGYTANYKLTEMFSSRYIEESTHEIPHHWVFRCLEMKRANMS